MSMDELEVLRHSMAATLEVDEAAEERAWSRLLHHMEVATAPVSSSLLARPHRRMAAIAAIVAAIAVVGLTIQALLPREQAGLPTARALLTELADTAAAQPAIVLEPGEFAYTHSVAHTFNGGTDVVTGKEYDYFLDSMNELWVGWDGSGRILRHAGELEFLSAADERKSEEIGAPPLGENETSDDRYKTGTIPILDLRDLPTERDALIEELERRDLIGGPPGDIETFGIILELLRDPGADPKLRSALFEAASTLRGVKVLGELEDPLGRTGTALQVQDGLHTITAIVDPSTSFLLAQLTVLDIRGGVEAWGAYFPFEVVDSITERPQ